MLGFIAGFQGASFRTAAYVPPWSPLCAACSSSVMMSFTRCLLTSFALSRISFEAFLNRTQSRHLPRTLCCVHRPTDR